MQVKYLAYTRRTATMSLMRSGFQQSGQNYQQIDKFIKLVCLHRWKYPARWIIALGRGCPDYSD